MNDIQFLEAVKMRLMVYGWHRGNLGSPQGPNCILGATAFVADPEFTTVLKHRNAFNEYWGSSYLNLYTPGRERLEKLLNQPYIWIWNDTQIEVESIFKKIDEAIAALKAEEKVIEPPQEVCV